MVINALTWLDLLAIVWFGICFVGYPLAARQGPLSRRPNLVAAVEAKRASWMLEAARRDVRIVDAQLLMTLSSGTAFFASTTVIVLGGLAAMLGSVENVKARLQELPYFGETPIGLLEIKIVFLMLLVVRAFFKFAWAFRLTHYTSIMMGAMPTWSDEPEARARCEDHARRTARLSGLAAHHNNGGLRTMYFAIAGFGWFLHPLALMIASTWVVAIVYRREFRSRAFQTIAGADGDLETNAGWWPLKR